MMLVNKKSELSLFCKSIMVAWNCQKKMFTGFFNQFSATVMAKSQLDRYEIIYFHKIWIKCNRLGKNHASGRLNCKFIRYEISKLLKFQGTKAQMGTIFGFWIFLGWAPTSICHFFYLFSACLFVHRSVCPSIHLTIVTISQELYMMWL